MADMAARAHDGKIDGRGYSGARITDTLGFVYEHEDLDASIVAAAESMIQFGVVDGTAPSFSLFLSLFLFPSFLQRGRK
jgi:hypothetical protein